MGWRLSHVLWAAQKQEAWDRQLDYLQQLQQLMISREEDIRNLQWDIMATASILQQWDLVRAIAAELEIELTEGEGFIDEKWGLLNIRFRENYEYRYYYAQRIGPVTARIIEPTYRTDYPQHVDEVVVFDAEMLNTRPEDEEEQKNFTPLYGCLKTIIPTEYGESGSAKVSCLVKKSLILSVRRSVNETGTTGATVMTTIR